MTWATRCDGHVMHRHTLARLLTGAALLAGALTAVSGSAGSAEGPQPGLPGEPTDRGNWTSVIQGGTTEAKRAKQWARVPMQVTTVYAKIENRTKQPQHPVANPDPLPPDDPRISANKATNYLYLMSEDGYGRTAPFTVRTTAFGSIPTVATLRLEQRRDADGLPVPIIVTAYDDYYEPGRQPSEWPAWAGHRQFFDTEVSDSLSVSLESVEIDGVDLGLRDGCRTKVGAKIALLGKGWIEKDPAVTDARRPWLSGHYAPGSGGRLSGTADVPPFVGCVTASGEDVSALLTTAISGPGNSVTLHATAPFLPCPRTGGAPVPGTYDATKLCPGFLPGTVTVPPQQP